MKYAHDVIDGKVVAGELVRLACVRFLRFLEDERYEFQPEAVERVLRFSSHLRHYTGKHAGKPFKLEPWQQFLIASIFGFFKKEDGSRLTKSVYIEIARKNGKTALAAGPLALYGLIADNEMNAEVDLAANSRDQARIAFSMCRAFAQGLNPKGNRLKIYRNSIEYPKTLSKMTAHAADSAKLDGHNSSMSVIDEMHEARDGRLHAVFTSSMAMRDNPLDIVITTAGFNKNGPCYELRTVCSEILHGVKTDDSQVALIYSLDETDDWKDESIWAKANPNLDVTVRRTFLREQVRKAINNPAEEVNVKTKNFNVWCDAETVWIPDHYILQATQKLDIKDFAGCDCWAGVDLAAVNDLTALALMIPRDDKLYYIIKYYLPEAALSESRFNILYGDWRRRGLITITPGNVTDYDYILNDLMDISNIVNLQTVAYDSWNATQFTINAEAAGLPMEPFSQALGNFNRPTSEFTRLCLGGKVVIDNNEINRYCLRNVVLKRDHNGNSKPSKQFAERRIDGVVAALEATGVYLTSPRYCEFY